MDDERQFDMSVGAAFDVAPILEEIETQRELAADCAGAFATTYGKTARGLVRFALTRANIRYADLHGQLDLAA